MVSGRWRFGDMALSCFQVMPLTVGAISSKSDPAARSRGGIHGAGTSAPAPARPISWRKRRRDLAALSGERSIRGILAFVLPSPFSLLP
jgi:hypothetical protein